MTVAELWSEAVPVKGTIGERFLNEHDATFHPMHGVRFLPSIGFRGGIVAAPAVVFAIRPDYNADPVALEAWPMAIDGRCAARLQAEVWADDDAQLRGAAVHVGQPTETLALIRGGLDALAVASLTGATCWGFGVSDTLESLVLPASVKTVNLILPRPPAPALVTKWRAEGRDPRWVPSNQFWKAVSDVGDEVAA